MGIFSKTKGHAIEKSIAHWLEQQGVELIAQNFHCKGGEIDLIALAPSQQVNRFAPKQTHTLLFIEVKYSQSNQYGEPYERVDIRKQQRLIHCAQYFLKTHPNYQHYPMRFDVISQVGTAQPIWIQDAFQAY